MLSAGMLPPPDDRPGMFADCAHAQLIEAASFTPAGAIAAKITFAVD